MSLRSQAASAVRWTGLATVAGTLVSFLQRAVLARLLTPSDFGLASMAMVLIGFAQTFADFGVSNAIVQKRSVSPEQLSSLYWLNLGAGALVFAAVVLSTPLVEGLFGEPRLGPLVWWTALGLLIAPVGNQFQFLLQRSLRFRELGAIELASTVVGAAVGVASALAGAGVLALVWAQLATTVGKTAMLWQRGAREWRPRLHFAGRDLGGYLSFGLFQMGEASVTFVSRNVDVLIIGRHLGAEILGFYTLALQLVVMPYARINPIVTRVALPILSRVQDRADALREGFLEMTKLLASIVFPVLIGLAAAAPVVVPVFFGPGWERTILLVQILAAVGLGKTLGNALGPVLLAKGRADLGFYWVTLVTSVNTAVFWLAVRYGVIVLACSYVAVTAFYLLLWAGLLRHAIDLDPAVYFTTLAIPTGLSLLTGAVVLGARGAFAALGVPAPLALAALVATGAASYLALNLLAQRDYVRGLLELAVRR